MTATDHPGPRPTAIFDDRERAFEAKFRREEEIAFRADARAAHLLGLWAADRLGLSGPAAETYARTLVETDILAPAHRALFAKIRADLAAQGIEVSEAEIQGRREGLLEGARRQVEDELRAGKQSLDPMP